ncbi:MAG TPA: porin [Rhizobiales bacterium]|nr:porin [Hyphomicrobiales bacterium]
MNIKSLLLGSAAALVAVSGARAADAVVVAEPEPVEYVRVCDVYGAGFFYIPGTENCLQIGGYVRYQMNYNNLDWTETDVGPHSYRFWKLARFAPTFDVRSETEWGTLRAFAEVEFDWNSYTWSARDVGTGAAQSTNLNHAFIELTGAGTLRLGKGDTPYARFLGYGNQFGPFVGSYGFRNSGEVSYTFHGGNGFSAVIAAIESSTGLFEPAVEVGARISQGWGTVGAMVAYDTPANAWSAKGVARVKMDAFSAGVHVFYSNAANAYTVGNSELSVLGHARVDLSNTFAVAASVQWFDRDLATSGGTADRFQYTGAIDWRPVAGLRIRPEVSYTTGTKAVEAAIRFDRSF